MTVGEVEPGDQTASDRDAFRAWCRSAYAQAFQAPPMADGTAWLLDLRLHAVLALLMARAACAPVPQEAWTQRGLGQLSGLSASAVHTVLTQACDQGEFSRQADRGDRRRTGLMPSPSLTAAFTRLVRAALGAATAEAPEAVGDLRPRIDAMVTRPDTLALYARLACAVVAERRPGGRLWHRPAAMAVLADMLLGPEEGIEHALLLRMAARRGAVTEALREDLGIAGMAGLISTGPQGGLQITAEGRAHLLDHLRLWRDWAAEARMMMALGGMTEPARPFDASGLA